MAKQTKTLLQNPREGLERWACGRGGGGGGGGTFVVWEMALFCLSLRVSGKTLLLLLPTHRKKCSKFVLLFPFVFAKNVTFLNSITTKFDIFCFKMLWVVVLPLKCHVTQILANILIS